MLWLHFLPVSYRMKCKILTMTHLYELLPAYRYPPLFMFTTLCPRPCGQQH